MIEPLDIDTVELQVEERVKKLPDIPPMDKDQLAQVRARFVRSIIIEKLNEVIGYINRPEGKKSKGRTLSRGK